MSDASPRPWRLTGQTIRDAEGAVVMSAINPADMETRRLIVDAVNTQGNAAAMRAALELCVREMRAYCRAEAATTMPGKECLDGCEALRIAKSALAAPPRNCDRYATWKDAWDAFAAAYFGPTDPGEMEYSFGVWLFAPAKEAPNGRA